MRSCGQILTQVLCALALASAALRADPGDVESSRDYADFPRLPGFIISDYDEDNPAEFDFPVARPLPIDSGHVGTIHVRGHRYIIRYELIPGSRAPGLYQTQLYYEKLAADAGFTVEKNGAVGNVTETFYRETDTQQIWVYLEPDVTVNVLTVVESTGAASPPPPRLATTTAAPPPEVAPASAPTPTPVPPAPIYENDDSLYADLSDKGRIVLPFVFQPGRDELAASSQPLIDRVVAMMNIHPELFLRIEGHTDNTGNPDDDLRLSAQRALAVQAKLIAAHISKKRLDAVGVGGLQPLADNDTPAGREKNRRIELVMWKKNSAFHPAAPNGQNYYPGVTSPSRSGVQN